MTSYFLNTITRARTTGHNLPRRVVVSLARYAVLGLVALSILPACAAEASHALAAHDQSNAQGNAEPGQISDGQTHLQEQQPQASAAVTTTPTVENNVKLPPKINRRPFKELFEKWGREYRAGRLDLSGTIALIVEADRNEDGTLENMALTGSSASGPRMVELVKDFAATLSESRALEFLEGVRHIRLNLKLDQQKLDAVLNAEADSEQRAASTAQVYDVGLKFQGHRKAGTDEGIVWNNMKVSASGKVLTLKLEMSREALGNLLLKQITPN